MATLTRRLQVLLPEQRFRDLEQLAQRRATTVAALVREALDVAYPPSEAERREAAQWLLDRPPLTLGTWDEAKADIEKSLDRGV